MKFRQKPNGMWLVDYEDEGGARKRVSTGIKTAPSKKEPAEVRAAGRDIVLGLRSPKAQAAPGQTRKEDGRLTMSDLFDKCELTIWHPDEVRAQATIRSNLKFLRPRLGDVAVADMSYTRLEQFVTAMKAEGYQPATIKRRLAMVLRALSQATKWTDDKGQPLLISRPPAPRVVVNNLKERTITPLEEQAIFNAVEKRRQLEPSRQWFKFRVLLWLLFDTGSRIGEALVLGPVNVSAKGDRSYLTFQRYRTKSGKPRTVPLAPRSVNALGSLMDHLSVDKKTGEWRFFGFTVNTAQIMFAQVRQDIRRETGMDLWDVTLHTIRHTTLTRLAQGGMDLARLQQWAGHSDPKITAERYLHLLPSDLDGGLAILGAGGTPGDNAHAYGTRPVIVPDTFAAANGANRGTATAH